MQTQTIINFNLKEVATCWFSKLLRELDFEPNLSCMGNAEQGFLKLEKPILITHLYTHLHTYKLF
jgi:hypothetical protein